jgi:tetratricopeptide (TPR) repeat protein
MFRLSTTTWDCRLLFFNHVGSYKVGRVKGSTAQVILKTLKGNRLKAFLEQLSAEANGKLLVEICNNLLAANEVSETDMRERSNLTKGKYYYCIELIGIQLLSFLHGKKIKIQLEETYLQAQDFMVAAETDAAIDLIKTGIKAALPTEEFEIIVRLIDLLDLSRNQETIDLMDALDAHEQLGNLNEYMSMLAKLRHISNERNAVKRRTSILEILQSHLLQAPTKAKSRRALFHYWKAKEVCYSNLREYDSGIACQEALLAHIEAYPWICIEYECTVAKETRILVELLRLAGKNEKLHRLRSEFDTMKLKNPVAIQERDFLQFPISIAAPIQFGNTEEAIQAISAFLTTFETNHTYLAPTYITENLYCCLYGAIATNDEPLKIKTSFHLSHFGKSDFKPKYFPLYRFLEIIMAIEAWEWEDATRLLKNLKTSGGLEEVFGLRDTLGFMMTMVKKWSNVDARKAFLLDDDSRIELSRITDGQDIIDFFDLPAWFKSKEKGCSMMEIFHQRAASSA